MTAFVEAQEARPLTSPSVTSPTRFSLAQKCGEKGSLGSSLQLFVTHFRCYASTGILDAGC